MELMWRPQEGLLVMGNEDRIAGADHPHGQRAQFLHLRAAIGDAVCPPDGEKVAPSVRDTGAGIDPGDLPYIWERFYKADKYRMRTSGTGLGLSIAKLVGTDGRRNLG